MTQIVGLKEISHDELADVVERGDRFLQFEYAVSLIAITFRRAAIHYVKAGESPSKHSLPYTLLTFLFGWWGIPFGPIWSIAALNVNNRGGTDVTAEVVARLEDPKEFEIVRQLGEI